MDRRWVLFTWSILAGELQKSYAYRRCMTSKVCFLGGARYSGPLDTTSRKKFSAMKSLGEIFVIGFSEELRPPMFTEYADFYLVAQPSVCAVLRYLEIFVRGSNPAMLVDCSAWSASSCRPKPVRRLCRCLGEKVRWLVWIPRWCLLSKATAILKKAYLCSAACCCRGCIGCSCGLAAHFAFKHADAFRTISDSTRRQLENWMPGRPIVQFPAWTDMEVFLAAGYKERYSRSGHSLHRCPHPTQGRSSPD